MDARRSIRLFSDEPVPVELIEQAVANGIDRAVGCTQTTVEVRRHQRPRGEAAIRAAAEEEERVNYLENRMNEEWQEALAPLGTDHHKEFLEVAPWIVVLFEERFEARPDGERRGNYYVKESCGIAAGLFIARCKRWGWSRSPIRRVRWHFSAAF